MPTSDGFLVLRVAGLALLLAMPLPARASGPDPDVDVLECATQRVRELEQSWGAIDPELCRELLQERWDFPDSLATEHVLILHALDEADPDHAEADYVSRLATYMERAWGIYSGDPRFDMPEAIGTGPAGTSGRPLVLVRVMRLDDAAGYARAEDPVPGRCLNSRSGSIRIRNSLSDRSLRTTSAHELWHVFTFAIDPFPSWWLEESTARWAEWQVWPDLQSLSGVWEFVRRPYQILWSESPSQRTYGGALFWTFLQERLGDPLAVHTWKRTCDAPWLLALREVLRDRHGRDFDELLAEFWQWNYRAGAADDGRHYLNGSRYPRLSYQAIARTFGPQVQSLPDNLVAGYAATNAILFLGPATHETLRITFDGAPELADRRVVSVAGTTWPNTHPLEIEQHPDVDGDCVFEISGWHLYDQVALLMTNYASAQDHQGRLAFSWIAEELGAPVFDVEWKLPLNDLRARRLTNAPNPFSASTQIRYRAESGASTRLEVYDIAGRRIRSLVRDLDSPFGGDYQAIWDGTDDRRRAVSSGIYFLHLRTASWTETRRIDIVR